MVSIKHLQHLAGINTQGRSGSPQHNQGCSNISVTGNEKAQLQKKHNIKPGTPEWFKLWFSLPYLTGERPLD